MKQTPKIGEYFTLKTDEDNQFKAKKNLRIITHVNMHTYTVQYNIVPQSNYHMRYLYEYYIEIDNIDLLSKEQYPEFYL